MLRRRSIKRFEIFESADMKLNIRCFRRLMGLRRRQNGIGRFILVAVDVLCFNDGVDVILRDH